MKRLCYFAKGNVFAKPVSFVLSETEGQAGA